MFAIVDLNNHRARNYDFVFLTLLAKHRVYISKNLIRCRSVIILKWIILLEIILLNHQNNYVERLSIDDYAAESFNISATSLNVLRDYSDGPNTIISRSR